MPHRTRNPRIGRMLRINLLALVALVPRAHAQATLPTGFVDERIVGGLQQPVGMAFLPDGRLFVVEQKSARILLVRTNGTPRADSVGFVASVNTNASERGLLGIAVDPGWPERPYVYVHSTHSSGKIRVSRFKATGSLSDPTGLVSIDPASRYELITDIPDNAINHNGGSVRFARDGLLYVSIGDDATWTAAQDTSSLRGVILRLDVSRLPDGPGTATRALLTPADNPFVAVGSPNSRLIWAWGLRNPFRIQFDTLSGAALIADVGENTWEELDWAQPPAGVNFGWPRYEGYADYDPGQPLTGPATMPIYVVDHASTGAASIMSAGIYRHRAGATRGFAANYEGDAFTSDYFAGFLRRLKHSGSSWSLAPAVPGQPDASDWATGLEHVSDWASGPEGGLWYCRQYVIDFAQSGEIRRIVSAGTSAVDPGTPRASFATPWPLPSRGTVELAWSLPAPARVGLAIYDTRGRRVRTLVRDRDAPAGPDRAAWDGADDAGRPAPAGVYFAALDAGGVRYRHAIPLVR